MPEFYVTFARKYFPEFWGTDRASFAPVSYDFACSHVDSRGSKQTVIQDDIVLYTTLQFHAICCR